MRFGESPYSWEREGMVPEWTTFIVLNMQGPSCKDEWNVTHSLGKVNPSCTACALLDPPTITGPHLWAHTVEPRRSIIPMYP